MNCDGICGKSLLGKLGSYTLVLSALALLILAFSPSRVVLATQSVPLKGSEACTYTWTSYYSLTTTCKGQFTLLGLTTRTGVATMTGPLPSCGGFTVAETHTYTAANGDQLFISFPSLALCPTSDPNIYTATGVFIITGGTGRFEAASGSGTHEAIVSISPQTIMSTLTGTMAY